MGGFEIDLVQDRIKYLRESTDFVSTLFESLIGYAIIASDFDGNIIGFNEGARKIYGYAPEEIIGKQDVETFFPEEFIKSGGLQEIIDDLIAKERYSYEGEKVRKNGDRFPAQILFTLTKDKAGKVVGFIEIVEDLTERKRIEGEKIKAQAMAERVERLEKELRSLERLSGSPESAVTGKTFGLMPLREGQPDTFKDLVRQYADLLDLAIEEQAYKIEHNISYAIRSLADQLGFLRAGPRDVVEIHTSALKIKSNGAAFKKARAYTEEGRLMVLELMGYLATYYRVRA